MVLGSFNFVVGLNVDSGLNLSGDRVLGMVVAFAVMVISVGLLLAAWILRSRSGRRAALVVVLAIAGLAVWAPARVAAASGSTLFAQSFANNTVNTTYPVT